MTRPKITVHITNEIKSALATYCEENDVTNPNDFIRRAICAAIGQPDLADTMRPRGRPWGSGKEPRQSAK